jgi:hypothetical protein
MNKNVNLLGVQIPLVILVIVVAFIAYMLFMKK